MSPNDLYSQAGVTLAVYQPSLAEARARKWAEIKASRDAAQDAGAVTSFGVADSDLVSRTNIVGAVAAAQASLAAGQPFSIDWTMKDNSVVTLDGNEMVQMGLEVMAHISAIHAQGRIKRAAIEAAETHETIAAIDWD